MSTAFSDLNSYFQDAAKKASKMAVDVALASAGRPNHRDDITVDFKVNPTLIRSIGASIEHAIREKGELIDAMVPPKLHDNILEIASACIESDPRLNVTYTNCDNDSAFTP